MSRTTPSSPLSHATPPRSPTAGGTPTRLAVAPASPSTPQCTIPASPRTPQSKAATAGASMMPRPNTPRTPRLEITPREPSDKRLAPTADAIRKPSSRALRAISAPSPSSPPPRAARPRPSRAATTAATSRTTAARVTGTFYGHRRARIALAVQERPGSLPTLVLGREATNGDLAVMHLLNTVTVAPGLVIPKPHPRLVQVRTRPSVGRAGSVKEGEREPSGGERS